MSGGLQQLASLAGIEPSFRDYFGVETHVSDATKRALLASMGFDLSSQRSVAASIDAAQTELERPPVIVMTNGAQAPAILEARQKTAHIELESGEPYAGRVEDLPSGYHRILDGGRIVPLIVAPRSCYLSNKIECGRLVAIATQLYALKSATNWGIGDFSDLERLARTAEAAGAAAIALNPLHELHPSNPWACSPYAPSSRLWLNSLYVDVTRVPEYAESPEMQALARTFDLERLRQLDLVDYGAVAEAKHAIFEALFRVFSRAHLQRPGDTRAARFRAFVRDGGAPLEALARYEALAEYWRTRDEHYYGWLQWPAEYRCPHSPQVERFAHERRARVDYFLYLQWLANEQLAAVANAARSRGVGLYRDLAVGGDRNGADAWGDRATLLDDISLGAPPDSLNALGQDWGLPPLSPLALRRRAYGPLVALLRANMRHATVLRIDHVMALRRAFCIPVGHPPREGAYLRYPFEEMLAVVALESVRNRCSVVGEDLGTVPEGFRERMREGGALSSRVLYFERAGTGFRAAREYPRLAAVSVGTHDLPPLAGWWTGDDIALRALIGLFSDEPSVRAAIAQRQQARFALLEALERDATLEAPAAARLREDADAGGTLAVFEELTEAVHRFLAKTPSVLAIVALEDIEGETGAINVPGTLAQYPNWRRKRRRTVEELERDDVLQRIGRIFDRVKATA